MYERMLDKQHPPMEAEIAAYVGAEGIRRMEAFEEALRQRYTLQRELRFPFGNHYGWGYQYKHKAIHLCYAFFEQGAFTVMIQIGDAGVERMEAALPAMQPQTQRLWQNRYPCGERGGWVHLRVLTDADAADALQLVEIKKKPVGR